MKAKAVWIVEDGKIEIRDTDVPEPQPSQVTVEVKACGVCAWDSYLFRGISSRRPMPYIIGHEAVGIISKAGTSVTNVKPGDKVFCAGGSNVMMAEYVTLPAANVVRIPDDVTDYPKWVGEPTCCTVNLLYKTNIEPGDHVAVIGAGYMGLLALMGITRGSQAGKVTVFDIRDDLLELARKYNPTALYNPETDAGKAAIKEIQDEGGADIVIEFSASDSGFALANELTSRPGGPKLGGKLIIGSWHRHDMTFDGTLWHMSGISVLNCSPMSNRNYKSLLPRTGELMCRGVYTPGELVTHAADYRDCTSVFLRSIDKKEGYVKGVITF